MMSPSTLFFNVPLRCPVLLLLLLLLLPHETLSRRRSIHNKTTLLRRELSILYSREGPPCSPRELLIDRPIDPAIINSRHDRSE
jgi:hypothetical protein